MCPSAPRICSKPEARTRWPEAGTIIVTGPYWTWIGPSIGLLICKNNDISLWTDLSQYDVMCIWVLAHHWQWDEETIQRYMAAKKLALISQIGLECVLYYNLYASTEFVLCLCWECNWIVSQFHSQICFWIIADLSQVALSANTATLCGNSFGFFFSK